MSPVPLTLVTGFLGSGKTTLVSHLLQAALLATPPLRFAVIENEFLNEVGVENELFVRGRTGDEAELQPIDLRGGWFAELYEFGGGCLCCDAAGDFQNVLQEIIGNPQLNIDHIIVETTGLAVPGPVARALETFQADVTLNGIVTVVDASQFSRVIHDEHKDSTVRNEAYDQVVCADLLILNKIELVSDVEKLSALSELASLNRGATVIETTHSAVELAAFLSLDGGQELWRNLTPQEVEFEGQALGIPHHKGLFPVLITRDEPLPNLDCFHVFLRHIIAELGGDRDDGSFVRTKGLVHVANDLFILQSVGPGVSLRKKSARSVDDAEEGTTTRVVIFAYGLQGKSAAWEAELRSLS